MSAQQPTPSRTPSPTVSRETLLAQRRYKQQLAAYTLRQWNIARLESERKEKDRKRRRAEALAAYTAAGMTTSPPATTASRLTTWGHPLTTLHNQPTTGPLMMTTRRESRRTITGQPVSNNNNNFFQVAKSELGRMDSAPASMDRSKVLNSSTVSPRHIDRAASPQSRLLRGQTRSPSPTADLTQRLSALSVSKDHHSAAGRHHTRSALVHTYNPSPYQPPPPPQPVHHYPAAAQRPQPQPLAYTIQHAPVSSATAVAAAAAATGAASGRHLGAHTQLNMTKLSSTGSNHGSGYDSTISSGSSGFTSSTGSTSSIGVTTAVNHGMTGGHMRPTNQYYQPQQNRHGHRGSDSPRRRATLEEREAFKRGLPPGIAASTSCALDSGSPTAVAFNPFANAEVSF